MIKTIIKLLLAAAIIAWLITSGKLDLSLVKELLKSPALAIGALILLASNIALSTVRWVTLINTGEQKVETIKTIPVNFIGQFFSTFLPGVVTGDFVKLIYLKDINPKLKKSTLITSVLVDRVVGLLGLMTLAGLSSLINYEEIAGLSKKMEMMAQFNIGLLIIVIILSIVLTLPSRAKDPIVKFVSSIKYIGNFIGPLTQKLWSYGHHKKPFIFTILLSIFMHMVAILTFWLLASPFANQAIDLKQFITIIPIGFITTAIPIAPAGAGVGHLVFNEIFKFMNIDNGASLFNLYFLTSISANLLGVIPYLMWKKKHTLEEAKDLEEN